MITLTWAYGNQDVPYFLYLFRHLQINPSGYFTLAATMQRMLALSWIEGQYFTPSKARCFGQITMSSPLSSNKPTRASISSLSEATHDYVVCNPLKWAFTSLTQEFKGKNCVRSGYLVDKSHALVQCTAKEHENCDIASNERPFHLCIVCFQPIVAQHFEILSMRVHAFSSSTVYL